MSPGRKSFSERVSKFGSTISFRRSKKTADTNSIPAAEIITITGPVESDNSAQLGLLGEDLEQKGALVGSNVAATLTEALYQAHDLKSPSNSSKPTAVTAEQMIQEAFGSNENMMSSKETFEPTMIAFVKGIMTAMQGESVKADMEQYAQRRAAQSISHATAALQQKGEEMGNMALESVAAKVHKSKPVPDDSIAGTSTGLPTVAEGRDDTQEEQVHQVHASIGHFTSKEEGEQPCIDPALCGIKLQKSPPRISKTATRSFQKSDIQEESSDEDPDLISMVLSPLITGFNKAFAASSGVAKRIFSALSIENIRDGLKCFLYDQYLAVLLQEEMVSKLRGFGSSAAHKMLEYLADLDEDLDESKETSNDAAVARSAATDDSCVDRELLPPLLEPVLAGILEVLKSSDFRPLRRDAVFSVTRWLCWRHRGEAA